MKNIIIDTCVLIHIIRETSTGTKCLEELGKYDDDANILISVVTKGEMQSFIIQNSWGKAKVDRLNEFLKNITAIDISGSDKLLLQTYTEIDAFSKRKIKDEYGNLLVGSARKMGKNDLWISATARALNIPLMTADGDFDHLNPIYLNVIKII